MHRDWTTVIFSDECTFSSTNDGPTVVYRPRGTRYDPRYVTHKRSSGHVTVCAWGWMSSHGLGVLHRVENRLTAEQYLHILKNVMLPSVRSIYPDGVIQFQQDRSPIHTARLVHNWLASQGDIDVLQWPPRGADLSPIENVWAETKRILRENWPSPPPRTQDELWDAVFAAWEEIADNGRRYSNRLISSMPRRIEAVIQANGNWTRY